MASPNCTAIAVHISTLLEKCWYTTKCYNYREGHGWNKKNFDTMAGFPQEIQHIIAYRNTDSKTELVCQLTDERFVYCKVRMNSANLPKYFRVYTSSTMYPLREQAHALSSSARH